MLVGRLKQTKHSKTAYKLELNELPDRQGVYRKAVRMPLVTRSIETAVQKADYPNHGVPSRCRCPFKAALAV